jgi:hypothetical protein
MMHIDLKPEPADFQQKVGNPGRAFLQSTPQPKNWKHKEYWTEVLNDLYECYNGVCAYSAHWIPPDCGATTVDHFRPKKLAPELAYEWSNYRLCSLAMNRNKGTSEGIIDPCEVQAGWFKMDFPSLLVLAGDSLTDSDAQRVDRTINCLKLNAEPSIKARYGFLCDYMANHRDFYSLSHNAPFLASELERQGIADNDAIKKIMSYDDPYVCDLCCAVQSP